MMGIALVMLGVGGGLFVALYFILSFSMKDSPQPADDTSDLTLSLRTSFASNGYSPIMEEDEAVARIENYLRHNRDLAESACAGPNGGATGHHANNEMGTSPS